MKTQFLAISLLLLCSCVGYTPNREVGEVYYNLGNAYLELNRHQDAIKAYSKALDYSDDFELARYSLARTYALRKEYDRALSSADELIESDPDSLLYRELKAWIMYLNQEYTDAIRIYNEVLSIDPIRETSLFNLALLFYGNSEYEQSIQNLEKLVSTYENSEYSYWLGSAYFQTEDYNNSMMFLDNASVSELPESYKRNYYFMLGNSYEKMLMFSEAVDVFRSGQTLENETDSAVFYFEEGRLQWNILENKEKATSLFNTAVQKGFNDRKAVRDFIENEDTVATDELAVFFKNLSLYTESEDSENTDTESSE